GALVTFPDLQIDPPSTPVITSFSTDSGTIGDHVTNENTLTLTGTATANSTVTVYDGGVSLGTTASDASGGWSYTTAALTDGAHNFTATEMVSGNTGGVSLALSVTVDTAAPVVPSITACSTDSGTVGDGITNDNTLTLTGSAEANATVKVYDGVTLLGSVTADGSGNWSYTTAALANGGHSLTATATDVAGNTSAASGALSVTIDAVAPVVPSITAHSTNSDGAIGIPGTVIESADSTSLVAVGRKFFLDNISTGSGPSLMTGGVDGQFGVWTPIGVEQTTRGYQVAWKHTGADQHTVWNTDSSGNQTSETAFMSGTNTALQSFETSFHQDLNSDGAIGIPGRKIFLDNISTGSGPSLVTGGVDVVPGQFGVWTPIGVEQTTRGYQVAWKHTGADHYTVWNTDSSGNQTSQTAFMSGT